MSRHGISAWIIGSGFIVGRFFFNKHGEDLKSAVKQEKGVVSKISILKECRSNIGLLGSSISILDASSVGRFSGFNKHGKDTFSIVEINNQIYCKIDSNLNAIFSRINSKKNAINSNIQTAAIAISLIDNLG
tara:strand:- start:223 stop:618 length:396 start_codon:yes stop_codon:yes gene_type:complete